MNRLIQKLGEYYNGHELDTVLEEEQNSLNLKQRILTPGGFLCLDIFVTADKSDDKKYRFSCCGLGRLVNPTKRELFRIEQFNAVHDEIKMLFDGKNQVFLTFEKTFDNITPYDLGLETLGEALKCVASFQSFIKGHYQELKQIIRSLR